MIAAQFEQHHSPARRKRRSAQDPSEDIGAVGAAVVGQGGLEGQRISVQEWSAGVGTYGTTPDDHIDASLQPVGQRREEIAFVGLDAVGPRAGHGPGRGRTPPPEPGAGGRQHLATAPAPVHTSMAVPPAGSARAGSAGQCLALGARHVDAGFDVDVHVPKGTCPRSSPVAHRSVVGRDGVQEPGSPAEARRRSSASSSAATRPARENLDESGTSVRGTGTGHWSTPAIGRSTADSAVGNGHLEVAVRPRSVR